MLADWLALVDADSDADVLADADSDADVLAVARTSLMLDLDAWLKLALACTVDADSDAWLMHPLARTSLMLTQTLMCLLTGSHLLTLDSDADVLADDSHC